VGQCRLTKNHSPELAKLAQQFRSDLGNEDPATMIKQITALVETWKGKTANTIQAKLVKDAQSQPRLFSKVFAARQAHTSGSLRTYTRVFIAISRKQFFVTEGEITQASRWVRTCLFLHPVLTPFFLVDWSWFQRNHGHVDHAHAN